jgi:hypothetical protein
VLALPEALTEYVGVGVNRARANFPEQRQEPAAMVIMAVAEDHAVYLVCIKLQCLQVGQKRLSAASIKKPGPRGILYQTGKTVLSAG